MEEPGTMRVMPRADAADAGEALARFGIATAVRDGAITIGIVLGLVYLFPVLISHPGWQRRPRHLTPLTGGLRLPAGTGLSTLSIGSLDGLGVLAACAAAAVLAGGLLLRLRDA